MLLGVKYVCSLPHIVQLADDQPELSLLPPLSHRAHQLFKDVIVQVVWKNHGYCRQFWFPPVEGAHGQGLLKEFRVKTKKFEMEDKFLFTYDDSSCIARLEKLLRFQPSTPMTPPTTWLVKSSALRLMLHWL